MGDKLRRTKAQRRKNARNSELQQQMTSGKVRLQKQTVPFAKLHLQKR